MLRPVIWALMMLAGSASVAIAAPEDSTEQEVIYCQSYCMARHPLRPDKYEQCTYNCLARHRQIRHGRRGY